MLGPRVIGRWAALSAVCAGLVRCSTDSPSNHVGGDASTERSVVEDSAVDASDVEGGLAEGGTVEASGAEGGPAEGGPAEGGMVDADGSNADVDAEVSDSSVPTIVSPWGVAPSASSTRVFASWAPVISAAGVGWVRAFDQSQTDSSIATARDNHLALAGIFFFSDPGPVTTFPVNSLPGFRDYVSTLVGRTRGQVRHWEVWNEPPNFTENKSPAAYATIVANAYEAAKAVDATVAIGLAAQSNHVNWLAQTLDAGAVDHFDYLTVHPYEILGLVENGWEAEYMSIVPTLRKMLADKNPAKKDAPIWFTEVGEPVSGTITADHQADTLVKAYVMGIAQGVASIHWFEPLDGDSGPFGLIDGAGRKRPSYTALSKLVEHLGPTPRYVGWLLLNDAHYAFVFEGPAGAVMIGWALPGQKASVGFGAPVLVVQPKTGVTSTIDSYELTPSPIILVGAPSSLVAQARDNVKRPFPWGGDFSNATSISFTAGAAEQGLHPVGPRSLVTVDGAPALDVSASAGQSFTVDPNFSSYTTSPLRVTAVVRRSGAEAAGFNLKYEAISGWESIGSWYAVPASDQWTAQTWTITDAQFVGKWGYHFMFDSDSMQNSKYRIQSVTVTKP